MTLAVGCAKTMLTIAVTQLERAAKMCCSVFPDCRDIPENCVFCAGGMTTGNGGLLN